MITNEGAQIPTVAMIVCSLLDVHISSVVFIFLAGVVGLTVFFIKTKKAKEAKK